MLSGEISPDGERYLQTVPIWAIHLQVGIDPGKIFPVMRLRDRPVKPECRRCSNDASLQLACCQPVAGAHGFAGCVLD